MGARRTMTRGTSATLTATLIAAITLTGIPAVAQQPGTIEEQIAAADAELKAAQVQLANTYQAFETADLQYQQLSAAAATAQEKVTQTRAEADAAATHEEQVRVEFDEFTSASYRHGSEIFSARAYIGSSSPQNLLDRASLLTALAGEHGEVMDATREAVEQKTVADTEAQIALEDAVQNRDAAASAKVTAQQAYDAAVAAENEAQANVDELADRRATLASQSSGGGNVTTAAGAVVLPAKGRLTSTYGPRNGRIHFGIDIANSIGVPILSAMAGKVVDSGPASGFGLWVRVQHAGGLITVYGHINESLVNVGQQVAAGEQIATLGNRGESTGPHLHFEVHQDGAKINPLPFLRSHGVNI
jgi:murein DD-endopeptidase MepM/ murein hydrolase activator NlpD